MNVMALHEKDYKLNSSFVYIRFLSILAFSLKSVFALNPCSIIVPRSYHLSWHVSNTKCYLLYKQLVSPSEAHFKCRQWQMQLAMMHNSTEEIELRSFVNRNIEEPLKYVTVGLFRDMGTDTWRWSDGKPNFYNIWVEDYPRLDGDCAVYSNEGQNWGLRNYNCYGISKAYFVCEKLRSDAVKKVPTTTQKTTKSISRTNKNTTPWPYMRTAKRQQTEETNPPGHQKILVFALLLFSLILAVIVCILIPVIIWRYMTKVKLPEIQARFESGSMSTTA